ncbi:hypothetical protein ET33_02850 [Paenibacillus tyrfis]|uniref:Integrase n=1 Tax=Paenibacillus tyrfis TaxID=1501230 RepID=A0A081P4P7_9BACL|nr:hypothetical protein ET33_02850 [Paenibacillus tyrfis]
MSEILRHSGIQVTLDIYSYVISIIHKETAKQYGDMLFREMKTRSVHPLRLSEFFIVENYYTLKNTA